MFEVVRSTREGVASTFEGVAFTGEVVAAGSRGGNDEWRNVTGDKTSILFSTFKVLWGFYAFARQGYLRGPTFNGAQGIVYRF